MSENQRKDATVSLTKAVLESAPSMGEMLEIPEIQRRWVATQQKLFRMHESEATTRFETEKILFMQKVADSSGLAKCDRFSAYAAFMQLCASNLTLREGLSYLIPYKGKMTFRVGWKGRLEQLLEIPGVEEVYSPQVVYSTDKFEYTKGMKGLQILEHKETYPRPKGAEIHFVYMVVERAGRAVAFMMNRSEVLNIRDRYSDSYKNYMAHLNSDHNKKLGKKLGDTLEAIGGYGPYKVDTPMWVSDEEQAFKKTLVHRVYNEMPNKLLRHYTLDTSMSAVSPANDEDDALSIAEPEAYVYADEGAIEYANVIAEDDAPAPVSEDAAPEEDKPAVNEKPKKQAKPKKASKKEQSDLFEAKSDGGDPEAESDEQGENYSDGEAF